jgi:hypothetical protein
LPVGAADPVRRLHAISVQVAHLKDVAQAAAGDDLMGLSGMAPALRSRRNSRSTASPR